MSIGLRIIVDLMSSILRKDKKSYQLHNVGYSGEYELQEILAGHPELLREDTDNPLLTVCREAPIEGQYLDILMVDSTGMPVAVEVKLTKNSEIRRKVAGQILEYASLLSNLAVDELDSLTGEKLSETLQTFANEESDNFNDLRKNCGMHLKAGEIRIIVAVDRAPASLVQIFEFLCKRSNLDVRLVQVNRYLTNENEEIIVPSILVKPDDIKSRDLVNPLFMNVILEYQKIAPEGFLLWDDDSPEWKQVCPRSWRDIDIHYEFIVENKSINVEIHLENENPTLFEELLLSYYDTFCENYPDCDIVWDQNWEWGWRLGLKFPNNTEPALIAEAMRDIIEETHEEIQEKINQIYNDPE